MVTHEKQNVITIDEIREQIINDVDIKPYCSPYKIYIVANAELMNPQAQNALLKTIEEPPEYAVIMLLTSNIDALLPTIRSRCVRLDLKVVDDGLVKKYLMEHLHNDIRVILTDCLLAGITMSARLRTAAFDNSENDRVR